MRRFLILGHTQAPQAPLSLNDAAGASGRWDILARCVTSALLVSHGVRDDTEVILALLRSDPTRFVRISGRDVRSLNPDERSTVALLSRALENVDVGEHETRGPPGMYTSKQPLDRRILDLGPLVHLREDAAMELESWSPPGPDATFVLSDHRDPSREESALLGERAAASLSLGPVSLQADQCIPILHNRLDRLAARAAAKTAHA